MENVLEGARGLGAMESNQRHITYQMKKRGLHRSQMGCEAMGKIIQGIMNQTLRKAYLKDQTTKRQKTTGSQEDRQDVGLIASKNPAIGRGYGT